MNNGSFGGIDSWAQKHGPDMLVPLTGSLVVSQWTITSLHYLIPLIDAWLQRNLQLIRACGSSPCLPRRVWWQLWEVIALVSKQPN
jgi:hypothetical protein